MKLSHLKLRIVMGVTSVALVLGGFMFTVWEIQMLATTNQLIHLLGALVAAALTWLYLRCLITIMD